MKKTVILLSLLLLFNFASILFQACCPKDPPHCLGITNSSLNVMDNSGQTAVVAQDSVLGNAFYLSFEIGNDSLPCAQRSFSLISSAYAFKCVKDIRYDTVVNYSLVSNNAYDEQHPNGADLKEIFKFPSKIYKAGNYDIFPLQNVYQSGLHTFTITIWTKSGEEITVKSQPIKLLK